MNFRNISSWCIRNPVFPIVLFVGLMLAGLIAFYADAGEQRPGHRLPGRDGVGVSQPGAAPNEIETQITQRVESAVRGVTGVEEINSSVREGNSFTFVQFQIGTPTDRAVNDVRNAIAQIRGNLARGHPRAADHAGRCRGSADHVRRCRDDRHDAGATQLVHRQHGRQATAWRRRHCRRLPLGRRRPHYPCDPRSGRAAVAGHYRRAGQPAASPEQHERRGRPRRSRRLRTVGARARQRPQRLRAFADANFAAGRPLRPSRRSGRGARTPRRSSVRSPR